MHLQKRIAGSAQTMHITESIFCIEEYTERVRAFHGYEAPGVIIGGWSIQPGPDCRTERFSMPCVKHRSVFLMPFSC